MEKRVGLVIGSFAPLHNGHCSLIDFGLKNCDFLYVFLCSHNKETIPGEVRLGWLEREYKGIPNIKIIHKDTSHMENTSVSDVNISKAWSEYMKPLFPDVNVIFSSEKYGDYVAEFMNIEHMMFDQNRYTIPISSTLIREKPITYWDYLPISVREYYTVKICICGTESTGKSTMTELLSKHYNVPYAREMGREICAVTNSCNKDLINQIVIEQAKEIERKLGRKLLISDTDLITTISYSQYLFNENPDVITKEIEDMNKFDIYLYLWNDVPFVDDGTRMGEPRRSELNKVLYQNFKGKRVFIITGENYEDRFNDCVRIIDKFLESN